MNGSLFKNQTRLKEEMMVTEHQNQQPRCEQIAVQGKYSQFTLSYVYPIILIVGTGGNLCNLLVYSHPFLRTSPTVRLLSVKAVANLGHILSMLLTYLYYLEYPGMKVQVPPRRPKDDISWLFNAYWTLLKYTLYANNVFSTLAVWLTVAAIGEQFLMVAFPVSGWSTMRNSNAFILTAIPLSAVLHGFILIYYTIHRVPCWYHLKTRTVIQRFLSDARQKFGVLPVYIKLVVHNQNQNQNQRSGENNSSTTSGNGTGRAGEFRPLLTTKHYSELERNSTPTLSELWYGSHFPNKLSSALQINVVTNITHIQEEQQQMSNLSFSPPPMPTLAAPVDQLPVSITTNPALAWWVSKYQSAYFWTSSLLCNLLPLLILLVCSVGIYRRLFAAQNQKFKSHSSQKQCVVRMALATTIFHLLLETPQVPVFLLTAIRGTTAGSWVHQEAISAIAMSTSLINASIPFILYLFCSARFRELTIQRFTCKILQSHVRSSAMSNNNPRTTTPRTTLTSRLMIESTTAGGGSDGIELDILNQSTSMTSWNDSHQSRLAVVEAKDQNSPRPSSSFSLFQIAETTNDSIASGGGNDRRASLEFYAPLIVSIDE